MVKYPFSSKLMFAIVMHDEEACRQFIEKLFPEKKVKEIHFKEREEANESRNSRRKSKQTKARAGKMPQLKSKRRSSWVLKVNLCD